jgi:hypothetical protein
MLKGELTDVMVQILPQVYKKYFAVDKKRTKILYVELQKVLYGLIRASVLFYKNLRKEFEQYGLEVSPYDPCMADMTTKGQGRKATYNCMACG